MSVRAVHRTLQNPTCSIENTPVVAVSSRMKTADILIAINDALASRRERRCRVVEVSSELSISGREYARKVIANAVREALRNDAVDISQVLAPADRNDLDLFGLDDETVSSAAEHSDDELNQIESTKTSSGTGMKTTSRVYAVLKEVSIKSDATCKQSELDDELDTLIGESYVVTDLSQLKRKKSRLTRCNNKANNTVAVTDDVTDVSAFGTLVTYPAIGYLFTLETFQKRAVYLERDEIVFVAAHTSAGKTAVAEHAIGLAMNRKTKVIHTSPIKKLSNQKFRNFQELFGTLRHPGVQQGHRRRQGRYHHERP